MRARPSGSGRADPDAGVVRTAADAYVFARPLLTTYAMLHEHVVSGRGRLGDLTLEPASTVSGSALPWADPGVLVRESWLDLRAEPAVLSHPDLPGGRYVGVELTDLFAHEVGRFGVVRTGLRSAAWAVVGPRWSGSLPPGLTGALRARSDVVRLLARTAVPGPGGPAAADDLRAGFRLRPLHELTGSPPPRPVPPPDWVPWDDDRARGTGFLDYLVFLARLTGDAAPGDRDVLARAGRLRARLGPPAEPATRALRSLAARGVALGAAVVDDALARQPSPHTTVCLADDLDGDHLGRAVAAALEPHAPCPQETLTVRWRDVGGEPLHGHRRYSLTFRRPPPARLGWSLSAHAEPSGAPLAHGPDGAVVSGPDPVDVEIPAGPVTFTVQPQPPSDARDRARWIRTAPGPFRLTARLYAPEPAAVHGEWIPPVLRLLP